MAIAHASLATIVCFLPVKGVSHASESGLLLRNLPLGDTPKLRNHASEVPLRWHAHSSDMHTSNSMIGAKAKEARPLSLRRACTAWTTFSVVKKLMSHQSIHRRHGNVGLRCSLASLRITMSGTQPPAAPKIVKSASLGVPGKSPAATRQNR